MSRTSTDTYIQLYSTAPAPSRDYYGLKVTDRQVILNTWNVTHGRYVYPKIRRIDLDDFVDDNAWRQEVTTIFGQHASDYITDIATRAPKLHVVPNGAMLRIVSFLSCNDILRLSQTSKIFWQLCNTNSIWRVIFMKRNRTASRAELDRGSTVGWRQSLRATLDTRSLLRRAVKPLRPSTSLHDKRDVEPTDRPKSKSLTDLKKRYGGDARLIGRFAKSIDPNYCQLKNNTNCPSE